MPKKKLNSEAVKKLIVTKDKAGKAKDALLENLTKYPIVQIAVERSGISRATFYRWKKEDQEFARLADEALEEGVKFVNDLSESKLIKNIQEGNNTSIIFWLKNHHDKYYERIRYRHEYEPVPREINPQKVKEIEMAMKNYGFEKLIEKDEKDEKTKND